MNVVVDTNVIISGIFWKGHPRNIIELWKIGEIQLIISPSILDEYKKVSKILSENYPHVDIDNIINLITINSVLVNAPDLEKRVCEDADDDKFLSCAIAGNANFIISGDKHLLKIKEYNSIKIIRPADFVKNLK